MPDNRLKRLQDYVQEKFDSDPEYRNSYLQIETSIRDCAFSYFWNPYEESTEPVYHFAQTTAYAGVDHEHRIAYIVFRGTDSALDWVRNLFLIPFPFFQPTAHLGFLLTWKLAQRRITDWLAMNADRYDSIVMTGHSLGGALAIIGAYELARKKLPVSHCITIGSPQPYWFAAKKRVESVLNGKVFRLERFGDRVTRSPPRWLGYRHVGLGIRFVDDFFGSPDVEPWPALSALVYKAGYFMNGGSIGEILDERLGPGSGQTIGFLAILIVAAIAAPLLTAYYWFLLVVMALLIIFGIASVIATTLNTHKSGRYSATRGAESALVELRNTLLRERYLSDGNEATTPDGKIQITITGEARRMSNEEMGQFVAGVEKAFKCESIETLTLDTRSLNEESDEIFCKFQKHWMFLRMLGYTAEEINSFPEKLWTRDGVRRPATWKRYYALGAMSRNEGVL